MLQHFTGNLVSIAAETGWLETEVEAVALVVESFYSLEAPTLAWGGKPETLLASAARITRAVGPSKHQP